MDPAIVGRMRIGHFRIGVSRPDFDNKLLPKLKAAGPSGEDPAIWGDGRWGYFKYSVKRDTYEKLKDRMGKV